MSTVSCLCTLMSALGCLWYPKKLHELRNFSALDDPDARCDALDVI